MKNIIKILALVLFTMSATNFISAQKYGHMNLGNLLTQMPDVKAAESQMEAFQQQKAAKGQEMVKAFEAKYVSLQEKAPTMAPKDLQIAQVELQQEQQAIGVYEQQMIQDVQVKRQELLAPILTRVEGVIKEIAETDGYEMIFDTSVFNAVLFAKESEDVTDKVKAKLGI